MLTIRENLQETIKGGTPDRFVNQYEFLDIILEAPLKTNPKLGETIVNEWGVTFSWPEGQLGPYEASLMGNPVADPERPLEVLRTVHSFDPCIACAVHMLDPEGKETVKVKAL